MEVVVENDYNDYGSMSNIDILEHLARRLLRDEPGLREKIVAVLSNGYVPAAVQAAQVSVIEEALALKPANTTTLAEAKSIMGRWFIHPDEVVQQLKLYRLSRMFGGGVPPEVKSALSTVPYPRNVLEAAAGTHVLVASTPAIKLGVLLSSRRLVQATRYTGSSNVPHVGYRELADLGRRGWHLVRREPLNGSVGKSYGEQRRMLPSGEFVPSAVLAGFAAVAAMAVLGEPLFTTAANCSDVVGTETVCIYADKATHVLSLPSELPREIVPGEFYRYRKLMAGVATAIQL